MNGQDIKGSAMSGAVSRDQLMAAIERALNAGDMGPAAELAGIAVSNGERTPRLLSLAAFGLYASGRAPEASPLLFEAQRMAPGDPDVLHLLGLTLAAQDRLTESVDAYRACIAAAPEFAPARFNLGSALQEAGDISGARRLYEEALALAPEYPQALAMLADLDAKAGRWPEARTRAQAALDLDPGQFPAMAALAAADIAGGKPDIAEQRIRAALGMGALSELNSSIALSLLGDALDAQGLTAEAFTAWSDSRKTTRALFASRFSARGLETPLDHARRLLTAFEATPATAWARSEPGFRPGPDDSAGLPREHVFLLGFPRSGTTLLEQVLATHPDVVTLEERETLEDAVLEYLLPPHGLAALAEAGEADIRRLRDAYWRRVARYGAEVSGRVFIDKMPIASVYLPVIARLFPEARILLARRDPRDVAFSCFRRRFGMNPIMYQFTTLEGTAAYFDAVMALSTACVARLPLILRLVRYESLVADFDSEVRDICRFIGLDWRDSLKDFASRAREGDINTPSSNQVARGLYREGAGQWRRYAPELAGVLPILEPWVERFGYTEPA